MKLYVVRKNVCYRLESALGSLFGAQVAQPMSHAIVLTGVRSTGIIIFVSRLSEIATIAGKGIN